jgi:hypothetical protein
VAAGGSDDRHVEDTEFSGDVGALLHRCPLGIGQPVPGHR